MAPRRQEPHPRQVLTPAAVFVNGVQVPNLTQAVGLQAGADPVLVRYDRGGRGHFVMRRQSVPAPPEQQPLAMRWFGDAGVIPFDVSAGNPPPNGSVFSLRRAPAAIRVQARGR